MRETIRRRVEEYIKYMKDGNSKQSIFIFNDMKYYPAIEKDIWLILKSFANDMRYMKMSEEWIPVIEAMKEFISLDSVDPEKNKTYFSSLFEDEIKKPGLIYACVKVLKKDLQNSLFPKQEILSWETLSNNELLLYFIFDNYLKCCFDLITEKDNLTKRINLEKDQWAKTALFILSEFDFSNQNHLISYIQQNMSIAELVIPNKDAVYFEIKERVNYHIKDEEYFPINRSIFVLNANKNKTSFPAWCNSLMFLILFVEKNPHVIEKISVNLSPDEMIKLGNLNIKFMKLETMKRLQYTEKTIEKRINEHHIKLKSLIGISNPIKKMRKQEEDFISNLHVWKIFVEKIFINMNTSPNASYEKAIIKQRKRL